MLNKIFLETDGLVVGGTQLTTTGGSVNVANNIYIGGNTVTGNLTVTGTFTYPRANTVAPVFSVFSNTAYNVLNVTNTPVPFNTIEYDSNNTFNPQSVWAYVNGIYAPPYSWAPNVPGYYQVNASVFGAASGAAGAFLQVNLFKQNAAIRSVNVPFGGGANPVATVSSIVYMNGVSDYLTVYTWQNTGGTITNGVVGGSNLYSFNGCFLRPA